MTGSVSAKANEMWEYTSGQFSLFDPKPRIIPDNITYGMDLDATCAYIGADQKKDVLPITRRVMVDWTTGVHCDTPLDVYDYEVLDSVCSLIPARKVFTSDMIYRVMVGKPEFVKISANQRETIAESLNKCSRAQVELDIKDLAKIGDHGAQRLSATGVQPGKYNVPLFPLSCASFTRDTVEERTYQLAGVPLVAQVAEECGRVAQLPLSIFNTPPNKSKQIIMIQANLVRRIYDMYKRGASCHLDMISILKACNICEFPTNQELSRRRHQIKEIMNHWKECNFIRGYSELKQGQRIVGYNILLSPNAFATA